MDHKFNARPAEHSHVETEIMSMNVKGYKFWIAGAARSGLAAARILKAHGAEIFVTDLNKISDEVKTTLNELQISYEEGQHSIDRMTREAQCVVLSPSIPLDKHLPMAARAAGLPIVSEIEVASWFLPSKAFVVAITGTNGKSTTTHFAWQLFEAAGRVSVACGNYGKPFCEALLDPVGFDTFALELSSYQLETTYSLHPNVSIFLNLQNDHQARYGNMDEYLKAKWRLISLTQADGLVIIDESVLRRAIQMGLPFPASPVVVMQGVMSNDGGKMLRARLQRSVEQSSLAQNLPFSQNLNAKNDCLPKPTYGQLNDWPFENIQSDKSLSVAWIEQNAASGSRLQFNVQATKRNGINISLQIAEPCLPGPHNQINIAVANLAAIFAGVPQQVIERQWESATSEYRHIAHRLEEVFPTSLSQAAPNVKRKLRFINDSKATNVESTRVAVRSFSSSLRLLLGGEPKGDLYSDLSEFLGKNIVKIYPFGKAAKRICEQLGHLNQFLSKEHPKMLDAAQQALEDACDGDIILLSPGCASFDEFNNFEHRGDVFKEWVRQLEMECEIYDR